MTPVLLVAPFFFPFELLGLAFKYMTCLLPLLVITGMHVFQEEMVILSHHTDATYTTSDLSVPNPSDIYNVFHICTISLYLATGKTKHMTWK